MTFKSFPKAELHLHLEGAASPSFIRQLAQEKSISLDGVFDDAGAYAYADFNAFLQVYEAATAALKSPEDYARLTRSVLEDCAENGVVYAETFVSPEFCGGRDVVAWKEYLSAMQEAADAADRDLGITLRGIVTAIRHDGPDKAKQSALCAAETAGDWIVGFGIAGDEMAGVPADFAYSFDMAREAGLQLTAHAGEWGGAKSVRDAIADLGVTRIGHGVQAINDPDVVDLIKAHDVTLEVCPGSNIALGVYGEWSDHPIAKLREAGVKVTVSTDDPPFFHTTMTHEFEKLHQTFGWGDAEFDEINANALSAAFCDAETKDIIAKRLERS